MLLLEVSRMWILIFIWLIHYSNSRFTVECDIIPINKLEIKF